MFACVGSLKDDYVQNLPKEVHVKAAQGFTVTAVLSLLAGASTNVALLRGGLAVAATLIEALTRPIIKLIFPDNPFIAACIQVILPNIIVVSLAVSMAPSAFIVYTTTTLILNFVAWIALNNRFYEKNVGMAAVL